MLATVFIALGFLLVLGLVMIKGSYERLQAKAIPEVYQVPTVKLILKISIFLFIAYSGFLIFFNWKLLLILLLGGILTARFTTVIFWDVFFGTVFREQATKIQLTKKQTKKRKAACK